MENAKQFLKLPKSGRRILVEYKINKDRPALFKAIKKNLLTQKTIGSRQVRLSVFRGLLRNHLQFSDADMKPIENTAEQKQAFFDLGKKGFDNHHEDIISKELIEKIINTASICELMIKSGLRVGELLTNKMKMKRGVPWFQLNKKKSAAFYPIHIIGDVKEWVKKFRQLRKLYKDIVDKTVVDRVNMALKPIIPEEFYKRSTHICRAIYVAYLNKFKKGNETLPQIITRYLHHATPGASVYYNHVVLANDVDNFLNE
jgi:integrase